MPRLKSFRYDFYRHAGEKCPDFQNGWQQQTRGDIIVHCLHFQTVKYTRPAREAHQPQRLFPSALLQGVERAETRVSIPCMPLSSALYSL